MLYFDGPLIGSPKMLVFLISSNGLASSLYQSLETLIVGTSLGSHDAVSKVKTTFVVQGVLPTNLSFTNTSASDGEEVTSSGIGGKVVSLMPINGAKDAHPVIPKIQNKIATKIRVILFMSIASLFLL